MAEKKELVEKEETFSVALTNDLNSVKAGLPQNFNIPRFVNNAVALLNGNDTLTKFFKAYPSGVAMAKQGLIRGAFLGLDVMNKEFYLIPYGSKLDFSISYTGLKKLIMKYSVTQITDVYAEVVKQGDLIKYGIKDGKQYLEHEPLPLNEGQTIGVYAVVLFPDNHILYTVMTKGEIEKVRKASKSGGAVWGTWYDEMAKKSALRRICKSITIDLENPQMKEVFDADGEIEVFDETDEVIDVEADEISYTEIKES